MTKRYPALNLDSLAAAIFIHHETRTIGDMEALRNGFEVVAGGNLDQFAWIITRDLRDQDSGPFLAFDPDDIERLGNEISEWLTSKEMHEMVMTWLQNQLGEDGWRPEDGDPENGPNFNPMVEDDSRSPELGFQVDDSPEGQYNYKTQKRVSPTQEHPEARWDYDAHRWVWPDED